MKLVCALLCSLAVLSGCDTADRSAPSESDSAADLERVLSADLTSLIASAVSIAEAAEAQDGDSRRKRAETCTSGPGDCEVCYSYDGDVTAGDFFLTSAATPCGVSKDSLGEFSYSLDDIGVTGEWIMTGRVPGDYTISASGFREAHIDITTPAGRTARYDAVLEITSVEVAVESLEPAAVEATLAYTGFGGHDWDVSLSASPAEVWGEVTVDSGASCALSGTLEEPAIDCAD